MRDAEGETIYRWLDDGVRALARGDKMREAEEVTRRRSNPESGTTAGIDARPDHVEQVAELIEPMEGSWLETLGDCLRAALEGLND